MGRYTVAGGGGLQNFKEGNWKPFVTPGLNGKTLGVEVCIWIEKTIFGLARSSRDSIGSMAQRWIILEAQTASRVTMFTTSTKTARALSGSQLRKESITFATHA